jgi:gamma-glutamyltranspeptidase/glutathione hydrolase
VAVREPLAVDYGGMRIYTNPPPSAGGVLIAFGLHLLRNAGVAETKFGSTAHLAALARVMALTNRARAEQAAQGEDAAASGLLNADLLRRYGAEIANHPKADRGTTHISVIDGDGNAAGLTVSNGEGCGHIIPGTGIMANNMLGEDDINPHGFHKWPLDTRMSSMMAPTLMLGRDGSETVFGSGGSNRIRTALLQVIVNLSDFDFGVADAVAHPRLHLEGDVLDVEAGFPGDQVDGLAEIFPRVNRWGARNMYFGGVHGVHWNPRTRHLAAGGDPRRGGATRVLAGGP